MVGALVRSPLLNERFNLVVVPTFEDGDRLAKLRAAFSGLYTLARLLARRQVDVIDVHSSTGGSLVRKLVAVLMARASRRPVVFHLHAGGAAALFEASGGGWQHKALGYVLRHADCVVALTPDWARRIQDFTEVRRIDIVGNVPNLPSELPPRTPDSETTVIFLGHLYDRKGVYELLEAFALLRAGRPALRLVLAGEGPELENLRSIVTSRPELRDAVDLPGWVDADQKLKLLASAACLVLPSYSEGLPLTLLEAMAMGVPVVATSVGGIPEAVADGREAVLVPPQDASALAGGIARILDDPTFAQALTASARARVRAEYSSQALAERMGRIFDDVLATAVRQHAESDGNGER